MHRIFAHHEEIAGDRVIITGQRAHHMSRVLRMSCGDVFVVVAPGGRQWTAQLEEIDSEVLTGRLLHERPRSTEPSLHVTLAMAILKGDKMDWVIQKATELGVHRLVPVMCQRSVTRIPPNKVSARTKRWQRIALQAAGQSQRCAVPIVSSPRPLGSVLEEVSPVSIMAYEGESQKGLPQVLTDPSPSQVTLLIGPEGGFAPEEVEEARCRGVGTVGLGPRILRAETAALALLSMVMFRWGDLGHAAAASLECPDMPDEHPE